jgi:hypothetical protein
LAHIHPPSSRLLRSFIMLDPNMIKIDDQDESHLLDLNQFQHVYLNTEIEGQSNYAVVASLAEE